MKCRKCGEAVRLGQRFCESCGAQADKSCSKCSAPAYPDARFCGTCGAPMLQSKQIAIDDAIARVEHAAWLAKQHGAVALEWRAVTALARLLEQNGQPEKARERLRSICGASAAGLDSAELDEAKSLLAALG